MKKIIKLFLGLVLIGAGVYFSLTFIMKNINLGMDLNGGYEIIYHVEEVQDENTVNDIAKILLSRLSSLGFKTFDLIVEGDNIKITIDNVSNIEVLKSRLSSLGELSFRNTKDGTLMDDSVIDKSKTRTITRNGTNVIVLKIVDTDKFKEVTEELSQKKSPDNRLIIWMDFELGVDNYSDHEKKCGKKGNRSCLFATNVSQAFDSEEVVIQGSYSEEEANYLVDLIKGGTLPSPLEEVSAVEMPSPINTVFLNRVLVSSFVLLAAVIISLCAFFNVAGFVSALSLIIYLTLIGWTYILVEDTLALASVIVIFISISVLTCLISINNKALKKELVTNKDLFKAFKEVRIKAFVSITDISLIMFISGLVLHFFKNSILYNFSSALIITSIFMIIAMLINNVLLKCLIKTNLFNKRLALLINYKDVKKEKKNKIINFIGKRKVLYVLLVLFVLITSVSLYTKSLNLSTEFLGGAVITVTHSSELVEEDITKTLQKSGYKIVSFNIAEDKKTIIYDVKNTLDSEAVNELQNTIYDDFNATATSVSTSNLTSKSLAKNTMIAIIIISFIMIIYIGLRFNLDFGISSVVTVLFNVCLVMGVFSILNLEINSFAVLAIIALSIYAFSNVLLVCNDSKDVFLSSDYKKSNDKVVLINAQIKQSLLRSLLLAIVAILPIIVLLIFNLNKIFYLNMILLIGVIITSLISSLLVNSLLYDLVKTESKVNTRKKK